MTTGWDRSKCKVQPRPRPHKHSSPAAPFNTPPSQKPMPELEGTGLGNAGIGTDLAPPIVNAGQMSKPSSGVSLPFVDTPARLEIVGNQSVTWNKLSFSVLRTAVGSNGECTKPATRWVRQKLVCSAEWHHRKPAAGTRSRRHNGGTSERSICSQRTRRSPHVHTPFLLPRSGLCVHGRDNFWRSTLGFYLKAGAVTVGRYAEEYADELMLELSRL